jgi:alpha-ketoglutarate-dependent taurine dioxygenase
VSMTALDLEVTPKSATIGADIRGVDLRQSLDADAAAAIRALLLRHKVIFFPEQHLEPAQHLAFARAFGTPTPAHPVIPGIEGFPEIFQIDYQAGRGKYVDTAERTNDGLSWHSDVTYVERPPMGSILNAVVMPAAGGDTQWTNQQVAYETLSESMREYLGTLTARHSGKKQFGALLAKRKNGGDWDGKPVMDLEPREHPVVRTHPETGARTLFVNPGFTQRIVQLNRSESDALLAFLYAHSTRPENVVRHHWHQGDLAFWDNRATQHSVVGDYGSQPRVIQRITLEGDQPV